MHSKWFANGAATKKMYLTVSHTEDGGMNFSYHYQTVKLTEGYGAPVLLHDENTVHGNIKS